jgi:hypothetical protein
LIIGVSGGVGTYAVQIAKALGAHVTGDHRSRPPAGIPYPLETTYPLVRTFVY